MSYSRGEAECIIIRWWGRSRRGGGTRLEASPRANLPRAPLSRYLRDAYQTYEQHTHTLTRPTARPTERVVVAVVVVVVVVDGRRPRSSAAPRTLPRPRAPAPHTASTVRPAGVPPHHLSPPSTSAASQGVVGRAASSFPSSPTPVSGVGLPASPLSRLGRLVTPPPDCTGLRTPRGVQLRRDARATSVFRDGLASSRSSRTFGLRLGLVFTAHITRSGLW